MAIICVFRIPGVMMRYEQVPPNGELQGPGSAARDRRVDERRPDRPLMFVRALRPRGAVVVSCRRHRFLAQGHGGSSWRSVRSAVGGRRGAGCGRREGSPDPKRIVRERRDRLRAGCLAAMLLCLLFGIAPAAHARAARVHAASPCPEATPSYDGPCGPLFTTPQWSDQSSWSAASAYETIGLVRLGRRSAEDLIGRDSTGLWVEQFDAHAGQWQLLGSSEGGVALALSDRDGWNRPSQYATIQTADLNGDGEYELLARAADGVHVYRWHPATSTFTDISKPPRLLSDAAGGDARQRI